VPLSDDAILSLSFSSSTTLFHFFFLYIVQNFFLLSGESLLADVGDNIFLALQDFLLEDDLLILLHIQFTSINPPIYLVSVYPS
jgi:hypothetical protein